jgi:hypothetical protein
LKGSYLGKSSWQADASEWFLKHTKANNLSPLVSALEKTEVTSPYFLQIYFNF